MITELWAWLKRALGAIWVLSMDIKFYVGVLVMVVMEFFELITHARAAIAAFDEIVMSVVSVPGLNVAPLSLANYFMPIDTALLWFAGWTLLYLLCVGIRIVKSWIPTMG